jgi:integrase/recombinase XerC
VVPAGARLREALKVRAHDRALGLLPYCASLHGSKVVRLDVGDVRLSACKGELRVLGKGSDGDKQRMLPVHAELPVACGPLPGPDSTGLNDSAVRRLLRPGMD